MGITREHTDLDKKPTWYLFLLANVIILIGCAATFMLAEKDPENILLYLPTLICNLCAMVAAGFFIWLESKTLLPQSMHYQRKWLKFYLAALIVFVAAIIFNVTFYVLTTTNSDWFIHRQYIRIIYIVITGVLTLVAIGLQRYARYRIDLDIYRRRHGEEIKQKEEKAKSEPKKPSKPIKSSKVDKPTGGLLDKME